MRLSQLKTETWYATKEGRLIRAVSPISNNWTTVPVLDDNGQPVRDESGLTLTKHELDPSIPQGDANGPKVDPWAARNANSGSASRHGKGVLVEYFSFDEDGNPLESQGRGIVTTSTIAGLWSDYLLLHGERVREGFTARKRREEDRKKGGLLKRRLKESGLKFPTGKVERINWRNPTSGNNWSVWETSATEVWTQNASRPSPSHPMYGKLPEDYPYSTFCMRIEARNETDIEYLLDVIEAGVRHLASLEKRREREARQRALKGAATAKKKPAKKTD